MRRVSPFLMLWLALACTSQGDDPTTMKEAAEPRDAGGDASGKHAPASDDDSLQGGPSPLDEPDASAENGDGADDDVADVADDDFVHTCTVGDETCICYPNDTCNDDLECDDGICRRPASQTGAGGQTATSRAGSGSMREAGAGGAAGGSVGVNASQGGGGSSSQPPQGGAAFGGAASGGGASGGAGETNSAGGSPVVPVGDDRCATVLLLIDRSTSMFASTLPGGGSPPFGAFPDRWETARAAVAALEPYASQIAFGAMTFAAPGVAECPVLQGADTTPSLDGFVDVLSILPPSAQAIPDQKADTPMLEALEAGYAVLDGISDSAPRYLVLLSDGSAEMCGVRDKGTWCGQDPAIGAAQAAHDRGITTLVVGIGAEETLGDEGAFRYFLDALAFAGQGRQVPPFPSIDGVKPCLQLEYPALTGDSVGDDFWTDENWRTYAQGVYGATGTTFDQQRFYEPLPDDIEGPMQAMVAGMMCR